MTPGGLAGAVDGRGHWLEWWKFSQLVGTYRLPAGPDGQPDDGTRGQLVGALDEFARSAGRSGPRNGLLDRLADVLGWVAHLAAAVLAVARRSRRRTRWFWFWAVGVPFGLGILFFVQDELSGHPHADGHRTSGWWGFLLNLLATSATQTAVALSLA